MSGSEPRHIAGRYRVVRTLGQGAFGTVYEAQDAALGRAVAVKTIRSETLAAAGPGAAELLARFRREAQVAARLRHPNVVTIYDVGEADGVSYLAMELIEGEPLDALMAQEGRLRVARAAAIGAQVAEALGYAHEKGVVHRDIKPPNVMVEPGDRVKVTDFGIAKARTAGTLTATGTLIGTPAYMSPEQARGEPLDGRSDLFSLGCVLYEMLTGRRAFEGESITGLIFKVITEQPVAIPKLAPEVPPELVRLVESALRKQRDGRPASGGQLARELLAFANPDAVATLLQEGAPAASPPPPVPAVAGPPPGEVETRALPGGPPAGAAPAPRPAPRRRWRLPLLLAVPLVAIVALGLLRRSRGPEAPPAADAAGAEPTAAASAAPETPPPAQPSATTAPTPAPPPPTSTPAPQPTADTAAPPAEARGVERVAVRTIQALIEAERRFRARHGRYGELKDLVSARLVPARRLREVGRLYAVEVRLDGDGFEVVATPRVRGPRAFVGDETGETRPR